MIDWTTSFELGIRFRCLRSAICCKRVREGVGLTNRDYLRIHDATQLEDFAKPIDHPVFSFRLNTIGDRCVFLKENNCSIYEVRPLLCRLYPFQVGVRHDGKLIFCLNHCPGVDLNDGEEIDECYVQDKLLDMIMKLEGEPFIEKLCERFLGVKKEITPLLQGRGKMLYSDWRVKGLLERIILDILYNNSLRGLTPWERLWYVYYEALPLLSLNIGQTGALVTERDVLKSYETAQSQINAALDESIHLRGHREKLGREKILFYSRRNEMLVASSKEDMILFRDPAGEEFTIRAGDILRDIPISEGAIKKEFGYLREIILREGLYGALVCDMSIDAEVLLLLRVADAIELSAKALTVKMGKHRVGISEITDAIRCVDGSLTDIAFVIVKEGIGL